ncbi:MAG: hypothetical protein BGO89_07105 [Candidatus Kapaibacterium thiocyanatum]|uniref:Uncharacterized protein n=1 Tax=Candidatus Kapaibacterium thiocyanatum TaxID=1895771 RepID=A0A1M3KYZ7_9BACT|nr:MAG: hypothetical protein BGO89_07105 ['Candidatus Kapabacteria' thiocyanatum]
MLKRKSMKRVYTLMVLDCLVFKEERMGRDHLPEGIHALDCQMQFIAEILTHNGEFPGKL